VNGKVRLAGQSVAVPPGLAPASAGDKLLSSKAAECACPELAAAAAAAAAAAGQAALTSWGRLAR